MIDDPTSGNQPRPWGMSVSSYCMLLHLSQFLGWVIPVAGLVLPIIMWAVNKDLDQRIDASGKIVLNWMISVFIYCLLCIPLCFILIGFIPLAILGICGIIFPIVGAIKADAGTAWPYPMSISFFKY